MSSALPWRSCNAVRAEANPPLLQRGRDDLRVVRMIHGRDDLRVVRTAVALHALRSARRRTLPFCGAGGMTSVSSALPWRSCTAVRAEADPPLLQHGRDDLRVVRTAVALIRYGRWTDNYLARLLRERPQPFGFFVDCP